MSYESENYRNTLANAVKETPKDERGEFLENIKGTTEYELAKKIKTSIEATKRKEQASKKLDEAKMALQTAISPTAARMLEDNTSNRYRQNLRGEHIERDGDGYERDFMLNMEKANNERFSTMFKAMLDNDAKEKLLELYKAVDDAEAEFVKSKQVYEDRKVTYEEIEKIGGENSLTKMFNLKSDELDHYIEGIKNENKKENLPENPTSSSEETSS